jgi:hypothetical protein
VFDRPYDVDDVVILVRDDRGYHDQDRLSLKKIGGILPVIGDMWAVHPHLGGLAAYRVVERFLSNIIIDPDDRDHEWYWIVVVEQIENDELFDFDNVVREIFDAQVSDEQFAEFKILDSLDCDNREPAYWTRERKEILRKEREARLTVIRAEEEAAKKN